jgi:hypothetical protein
MAMRAACILVMLVLGGQMNSAPPIDTTDREGFLRALRSLTTPELEQRKHNRREMQQRHYAEILYEVVQMDPEGALLTSLRSQAQLELRLPNIPLTVAIPVKQPPPPRAGLPGFTGSPAAPYVVALFEDRRFPVDPWRAP